MSGDTDADPDDVEETQHVEESEHAEGRDSAAEHGAADHDAETRDASTPVPPVTGDDAVDEAMVRLARSQAGPFAERIESGEHAHRSLQSRLGGLGGA